MSRESLVERLKFWRAERPDEWQMDEFIRAAVKLERERNELVAMVKQLKHERDDVLASVIRYQSLLECAVRGEEIIVGDSIVIGIDAELADEIEESFDESPKAALSALKAQWQAEAITEFVNTVVLEDEKTVNDADYMWDVGDVKDFSVEYIQRLQEVGDE